MTSFLLALWLLATLGQANPRPEGRSGYRISGIVEDAVTGNPVSHAQVSIFTGNEETTMLASPEGRFAFQGLDAGKYNLYASAPGYVREAYGQHGAFLVAIATGSGQDSEHLVFRLHPQALIYGRVTDERGEAVRGAAVQLFASENTRGRYARFVRAQTQTNDLGEYRFPHLLPGKYDLAVQARPWYAQTQLSAEARRDAGGEIIRNGSQVVARSGPTATLEPLLDVVYPITFYPGVTDERASAELVLRAAEKQEANITVVSVPAAHLRLAMSPTDVGTSMGVGAQQRVFGTLGFALGVVSGPVSADEYEVAGLPPGEVTLVVTTNKENKWTSRTIEADTSAAATVDVPGLPVTSRVSGRVLTLEGGPETNPGDVSLISTSAVPGPAATTHLQSDGTFYFPEIQAETYRIEVNLQSASRYVQTVSAKDAKASGRVIAIAGGNDVDLTITMGQGLGQLTGVAEGNGKPLAGVMVLLVPESGQEMERDSRMDESDSDGSFSLAGILPGNYLLLAIKDGWDLEWNKPGTLKPYLSLAQKISIAANQSIKEKVVAQGKPLGREGQ